MFPALLLTLLAQSCSGLSSEAKKIAGCYVIPEVSQQQPVMELNSDATCVIRAIKPGSAHLCGGRLMECRERLSCDGARSLDA